MSTLLQLPRLALLGTTAIFVVRGVAPCFAAPGEILSEVRISALTGGFPDPLQDGDLFGSSVSRVGDVDGDGVDDIAIGAMRDNGNGVDRGALWILFMRTNGTVRSGQKVGDLTGGFTASLDDNDLFGCALAPLGDLDGDGTPDLMAGAAGDSDVATNQGAAYVLFLNPNGTVKSHIKIGEGIGGFPGGTLDLGDSFGRTASFAGDLDDDGVSDVAVGALLDDDGGTDQGAVWVLFMQSNGSVRNVQKISELSGGLGTVLDPGDHFGITGWIDDLDGDCVDDLVVGANADDDGGTNRGAVYVLFMNTDGTVRAKQKISDTVGGFTGVLDNSDFFGSSGAWLGQTVSSLPGALAVGAVADDDGGPDRGAVWILFLNANGTVSSYQKISATSGQFIGPLTDGDSFGTAAAIGDLDQDGRPDMAVGASTTDDGGTDRGAAWILFLDGDVTAGLPIASWGGAVELRATFPARPGNLLASSTGDLYAGNIYYTGQDGDIVPIFRVPPGGAICPNCGDPIPDPDAIALDALGAITTPGNIVVGSISGLWSVSPTCDAVSMIVGNTHLLFENPQDMTFDGLGRLLFANSPANDVVAYDGLSFTSVIPPQVGFPRIAVDSLDLYVTVEGTNIVRKYDNFGTLVDGNFAQGTVQEIVRWAGISGLAVTRGDSLIHVELPSKVERLLLTNVSNMSGLAVDDQGFLYIAQANARRLLRVSPTPVSVPPDFSKAVPFQLQISPNPFRDAARFDFSLPAQQQVDVRIYDVAGRLVRELSRGEWPAGSHSLFWDGLENDGSASRAGIFFVEIRAGSERRTAKLSLVR